MKELKQNYGGLKDKFNNLIFFVQEEHAREKLELDNFTMLPLAGGNQQLTNTYSLAILLQQLTGLFKTFGMGSVFHLEVFEENGDHTGEQVNFLEKYSEVKLKQVTESVRFMHEYCQKYDGDNLLWLQEMLENSCDANLRMKIS